MGAGSRYGNSRAPKRKPPKRRILIDKEKTKKKFQHVQPHKLKYQQPASQLLHTKSRRIWWKTTLKCQRNVILL